MNTATIFFLAYFLEFLIDNVDEEFEAKKNNTLLSGNAGEENNLHFGGGKNNFLSI